MIAASVNDAANSARKNSANFIPEYSVLNPATSSDSASIISNGVTLISASPAISSIRNASGSIGKPVEQVPVPEAAGLCCDDLVQVERAA